MTDNSPEQPQFPEDAPDDLTTLVSPKYSAHEFTRLVRGVSGDPCGGVVWDAPDEEVRIMHYAASGYWGITASAVEHPSDREYRIVHSESNGSVTKLSRSEAFDLVDRYLRGECELRDEQSTRSGQQTLSEVS